MVSCLSKFFRSKATSSTRLYQKSSEVHLSHTPSRNSPLQIELMGFQVSMQCRLSRRCLSDKGHPNSRWTTSSRLTPLPPTLRAQYSSRIPNWRCMTLCKCKIHRAPRANTCPTWRGWKSAKRHCWDPRGTPSMSSRIRHQTQIACKRLLCSTHSRLMCK